MTKILLSGCNGQMGQTIARLADNMNDIQISAGYDISKSPGKDFPVFTDIKKCDACFDVIIDFSNPSAFAGLIDYAQKRDKPAVIATTGLSNEQKNQLYKASESIPVFFSANMSLGVNLLVKLVKQAAASLQDGFDIEIIEKHHNRKVDAPSGTALHIADSLNDVFGGDRKYVFDRHSVRRKRDTNEIGIHAVRGGTITGEHTVIFAGNDEIIEINHSAMSRDIFASGALKAAAYLKDKHPGMYTMDDLLSENL